MPTESFSWCQQLKKFQCTCFLDLFTNQLLKLMAIGVIKKKISSGSGHKKHPWLSKLIKLSSGHLVQKNELDSRCILVLFIKNVRTDLSKSTFGRVLLRYQSNLLNQNKLDHVFLYG